jgi:hypothetical protein
MQQDTLVVEPELFVQRYWLDVGLQRVGDRVIAGWPDAARYR